MSILCAASNDWHLSKDNVAEIKELIIQKCEYCKENGIEFILLLGDVFESRVSQREDVLTAFREILDIVEGYGLVLTTIPGNHDKTVYKSYNSFLDPFQHHPAMNLIRKSGFIDKEGVRFHFLPFFAYGCDNFDTEFNNIKANIIEGGVNILCSHMDVVGSINNDGSSIVSGLKVSDLKVFDKVILGHYHNTHHVGKNILHLPSIRQNNFGEDENKGITLLGDDLSYEIIPLDSTIYKVYRFDLNTNHINDIVDVSNEVHNNGNRNRFEIIGNTDRVKSFDTAIFDEMGIDVVKKYTELVSGSSTIYTERVEVKVWDISNIKEKFSDFCKDKGLDIEQGVEILNKIIEESNGKK